MKTIKLSETSGIIRKIAAAEIAERGFYKCLIGGAKVKIVKG